VAIQESTSSLSSSSSSTNDVDYTNLIIVANQDQIIVKDIYNWNGDNRAYFSINTLMMTMKMPTTEKDVGLISK
jgi:hypothetical protein